ncbi:unnamed protein product, partial [Bubo scandiacus]
GLPCKSGAGHAVATGGGGAGSGAACGGRGVPSPDEGGRAPWPAGAGQGSSVAAERAGVHWSRMVGGAPSPQGLRRVHVTAGCSQEPEAAECPSQSSLQGALKHQLVPRARAVVSPGPSGPCHPSRASRSLPGPLSFPCCCYFCPRPPPPPFPRPLLFFILLSCSPFLSRFLSLVLLLPFLISLCAFVLPLRPFFHLRSLRLGVAGGRAAGIRVVLWRALVRGPASLSDPTASFCPCSSWWWRTRKRRPSPAEGPTKVRASGGDERQRAAEEARESSPQASLPLWGCFLCLSSSRCGQAKPRAAEQSRTARRLSAGSGFSCRESMELDEAFLFGFAGAGQAAFGIGRAFEVSWKRVLQPVIGPCALAPPLSCSLLPPCGQKRVLQPVIGWLRHPLTAHVRLLAPPRPPLAPPPTLVGSAPAHCACAAPGSAPPPTLAPPPPTTRAWLLAPPTASPAPPPYHCACVAPGSAPAGSAPTLAGSAPPPARACAAPGS